LLIAAPGEVAIATIASAFAQAEAAAIRIDDIGGHARRAEIANP
jgi:hypothetical protein